MEIGGHRDAHRAKTDETGSQRRALILPVIAPARFIFSVIAECRSLLPYMELPGSLCRDPDISGDGRSQ